MTEKQQEEGKFLMLPSGIIEKLKEYTSNKGISPTSYTTNILETVFEAEKTGIDLNEAIREYNLHRIKSKAGTVTIPKNNAAHLISTIDEKNKEKHLQIWQESGEWYGKFLSKRIPSTEILNFLEKDLLISWGLDEVTIKNDDGVEFSFVCFMMSPEFTEVLIRYAQGIFHALGYREVEKEYLRGLAKVRFSRIPKT
ncbi:hypothetical protein FJY84_07070 [Candidatus Bathyarchaeota archaeon]|nr:hypothetical protein [Candidatus Bathyarchaeota archaeon]